MQQTDIIVVLQVGSSAEPCRVLTELMICHGSKLAWPGLAWPGLAWHGMAWPGLAWPGLAWHGMAWHGMAWHEVRVIHSLLERGVTLCNTLLARDGVG